MSIELQLQADKPWIGDRLFTEHRSLACPVCSTRSHIATVTWHQGLTKPPGFSKPWGGQTTRGRQRRAPPRFSCQVHLHAPAVSLGFCWRTWRWTTSSTTNTSGPFTREPALLGLLCWVQSIRRMSRAVSLFATASTALRALLVGQI